MDSAPSQFVIPANGIATDSNGGRTPAVSTSDGGRLTGAAPQPRSEVNAVVCPLCGGDDIVGSIRIVLRTGDYCDGETFDLTCIGCGHDFTKEEARAGESTSAIPAATKASPEPIFCCQECGRKDIEWTAWIMTNGGEVSLSEPPSDDVWCHDCEDHTGYITDYGFGFELWREAEYSGHYPTFAEALAEANESDRPYEIDGATSEVEAA